MKLILIAAAVLALGSSSGSACARDQAIDLDWCLMWTAPAAQAITVRGSWRVVAKAGA